MNYLNKINKSIIENNNEKKNKYINKLKIMYGGIKLEGSWVEILNKEGVFVGIMNWNNIKDSSKNFIGSWDGIWINNEDGELIDKNGLSEYIGYWIYIDKEKKEKKIKIKWNGYFDGKVWNGEYSILNTENIIMDNNKKISYDKINDMREKLLNKFNNFILKIEYDLIINFENNNILSIDNIFKKEDANIEYYFNYFIKHFKKYSLEKNNYSIHNENFNKYINLKSHKYFYNIPYTPNNWLYSNKIIISSLEEKQDFSFIINNSDFIYIQYNSHNDDYNLYIINIESIKNKKIKKITLKFEDVKHIILLYNIFNNFYYNLSLFIFVKTSILPYNDYTKNINDILDSFEKYSNNFIIKNIKSIIPSHIIHIDNFSIEYIKNIYCLTYEISNKDITDKENKIINILQNSITINKIDYVDILKNIINKDIICIEEEVIISEDYIISDKDIINNDNDIEKYIIVLFFINFFLLKNKTSMFIDYIRNEIIKEYIIILNINYDMPLLNNGGILNNLKKFKNEIINLFYFKKHDNKKFYTINLKFNYNIDHIIKNYYSDNFYSEYKKYLNNYNNYNNLIMLKNYNVEYMLYYNFNDLYEYLKIKDIDIDETVLLNYCEIFEDADYFIMYHERDALLFLYGLIFVRLFNKYYKNMITDKKELSKSLSDDFLYIILYFLNSCLNDDITFQHADKKLNGYLIKFNLFIYNINDRNFSKDNSAIVNSIKMKLLHLYLLEISKRNEINYLPNNDNVFANIKMKLLNNKILLYDINYKEIYRLVKKNYKKIQEYDYFIISMIGIVKGIYLKDDNNIIYNNNFRVDIKCSIRLSELDADSKNTSIFESASKFGREIMNIGAYNLNIIYINQSHPVINDDFYMYCFSETLYLIDKFIGESIDEKVLLMEKSFYNDENSERYSHQREKEDWDKIFYNVKILPNNKTSIKFINIINIINKGELNSIDIEYINNINELFCIFDNIKQHGSYKNSMAIIGWSSREKDLNVLYSELISYRVTYFKDYSDSDDENFIFKNLLKIFNNLNIDNYLKIMINFSEKFNSIFIILQLQNKKQSEIINGKIS